MKLTQILQLYVTREIKPERLFIFVHVYTYHCWKRTASQQSTDVPNF
jgi:hypothetical protein